MIRNAYATGLKVWVPNADIEARPKRYLYGSGIAGYMALDEDGRFVLVNEAGRRVYMSQVACYDADAHYARLRGRRIWLGQIEALDHTTGLVTFGESHDVDPLELVKLVSDEPVTGTERTSFYIVDTSHLSSSLLGRKAHGYTYLNARPDDTYPDSRYEHVSTGSTSHAASTHDTAESDDSPESSSDHETTEAVEAVEPVELEDDGASDMEFNQWLLNNAPAPPALRLIYPPLKPPRRLRTRRASKRSR